MVDQPVEDCALLFTLDQLGAGVDQGRPAHRASMTSVVKLLATVTRLCWRRWTCLRTVFETSNGPPRPKLRGPKSDVGFGLRRGNSSRQRPRSREELLLGSTRS